MRHASLFSGIGGFDLAAEQLGWTNLFNCEINPYCRRILDYHFPKAVGYQNIMEVDFKEWKDKVDVLSGGFPCQPFSISGLQKGEEDERYLWPEMLRTIEECQPRWIVGENVLGLLSIVEPPLTTSIEKTNDLFGNSFEIIQKRSEYVIHKIVGDLQGLGYDTMVFVIPACAIGAPHRRDRVWIVATNEKKEIGKVQFAFDENSKGSYISGPEQVTPWQDFPSFSPVCKEGDGLPRDLDNISFTQWRRESVKAYGNAIVPQIAKILFGIIDKIERQQI